MSFNIGTSGSLCLFAHYDAQDRVDPYVWRYLQALVNCGFQIVFVSTSLLSERDIESLSSLCLDVIKRPNAGLDFASWATAYERYGKHHYGELLLANDSVYGPIGDLNATVNRLRALPGDVKGLVESQQNALHLQSWFVLLSQEAHRSSEFARFIAQDFLSMSKREVVEQGEIALSQRLRLAGFQTSALFSLAHRPKRRILRYNPTHTMWRDLIVNAGVPFIKVELLRDNPVRLEDLWSWREVINQESPDLVALIEQHRQRLGAEWAGARPRRFSNIFSRNRFAIRDIHFDRSNQLIKRNINELIFEFFSLFLILKSKSNCLIKKVTKRIFLN